MPRNGAGTYTLPSGNPVEAGTVIEAAWANTTLEDVGNELTNSLSRTGEGGMLAPFRLDDGTFGAPGLSWLLETSSGFYRAGTGEFWAVVLSEEVMQFTDNGVLIPSGKTLTVQDAVDITGALNVTGNFAVNTNKFNVTAASGNTTVAGTLGVTGLITATGGVSGNVTGNLTGNVTGNVSGNAGTVTNGVYTTGSYANPSWLTSLAGSKITGNITGNAANVTGTVAIANGGTGQTSANAALNALLPSQTSQSGKYLKTDGTNSSWDQLDISTADITGTLPILNGGTGQTTANAAFNALAPSQATHSGKYLKTDGTNTSWDALDISTADITGVLSLANGGTGASSASGARTSLGLVIGTDIPSPTGTGASGTWSININGNAATVTNGVITTASYADPSWITSLQSYKVLPSYASNALKFLRVNAGGTDVEWATEPNVGTVTSVNVSAGTTGLTATGGPITSSGTITLEGTLVVANGGTGQTSYTDGQLLIGNSTGNTLTKATLTAGSGVSIANGGGSITISATGTGGTVTSVSGTGTVNGITLTGSVTTTGSLTLGGTLSGVDLTSQVTGVLPVANGGSGQSTYTDGQLLIGNSTGNTLTKATLTAGTGISVTNGGGAITIAATNLGTVTSIDASGGSTGMSFTGGPVTSSGTLTLAGTLDVDNGGTGQNSYTDGQILIGNSTGNTLTKSTLTAGTGVNITNGNGSITIAATNNGTVTSVDVSGGTTGLTTSGGPVTSSGTITLGGTLAVANGGTGQTSYTDGQLLIGNSTGNTLSKATLTAGAGISITNGAGAITITASGGGGNVTGPGSSTDNAIARYDGVTGQLIQNSAIYIDDTGNLGVGTTTPVFGSGDGVEIQRAGIATLRLENSTASNSFELYADTAANGINLRGRDSSPMLFWTGNTERVRIGTSGEIGLSGANYGTAGQVLTSNGSGAAPTWQAGGIGMGKAIAAALIFG
jgi:hypothetical protein